MQEPIRALIVEDSEDDALLLVRELERGGYQVSAERAATAEEVRDALVKGSWNIVFSDYTMPQFRGTDALDLVRQSAPDLPFIFVSGTIGEERAAAAMKAGANDYIVKGDLKRLIPVVERELHEARVRRQRRRAEEQVEQERVRSRALLEILLAIHPLLEPAAVANRLLEKLDELLAYPVATAVALWDRQSGALEPFACRRLDSQEWKATTSRKPYGVVKVALEGKGPVMVRNAQLEPLTSDSPAFLRRSGLVSYLGVPLIAESEFLGLLSIYTRAEHDFSKEEVRLLTAVADQAAIALRRAQLFERAQMEAMRLAGLRADLSVVLRDQLMPSLDALSGYVMVLQEKTFGDVTPLQEEVLEKVLAISKEMSGAIDRAVLRIVRP